jgi:hypothetical protein
MRKTLILVTALITMSISTFVYYKIFKPRLDTKLVASACRFLVEGGVEYSVMFKDKKIRVSNFPSKSIGKIEAIIKDGKIWAWWNGGTAGVLAVSDDKGVGKEINDSLKKNKSSCQTIKIDDLYFDLPPNVVFSPVQ